MELTTNAVDDGEMVEKLLKQIDAEINSFTADGAYDQIKVRKALHQQDIHQIIPPQHNAVVDEKGRDYLVERNNDIATIQSLGRKEWKTASHYHQRSKAETFMYRYKIILGGCLQAREFNRQQTEVKISCNILNLMLSRLRRDQTSK